MTGEQPPIVFGIAGWCRLVAHDCTIPDCACNCHQLRPRVAPHRPTLLPAVHQ